MPVYTYRCENCGVQFDQKQKFSDSPLITCPECGKKSLRKVFQPVSIVFKGSGFYATDHKSPSGLASNTTKEEKPPSSEVSTAKEETSKPAGSDKKVKKETPAAPVTP